jgi:hypothetical protein
MSKRIPIPPELEHLIEKRDDDADRRKEKGRRKAVSPEVADEAPAEPERREKKDRRGKRRRKADP